MLFPGRVGVGITQFSSFNMIEWQYLFAASLLATIPVVILFMTIEKHLTAGLSSGGVKGQPPDKKQRRQTKVCRLCFAFLSRASRPPVPRAGVCPASSAPASLTSAGTL